MSNNLDLDQDRQYVGPDLDLNCLQRFSADDKSFFFTSSLILSILFVCLFVLILYVPSTIFQLNRDGSFLVEPVLS